MDLVEPPAIDFRDEVTSTNDLVMEMGREGAPDGAAVAARAQTAGRGRRGHVWQSPAGGVYLSILLRPAVPMQNYVGLPAVCALGALDAFEELGCEGLALKWPNDVVLGSSKVAGIIVEGGYSEEGPFAVCGIGINLDSPAEALSGALAAASDGSASPLSPACLRDACTTSAATELTFEGVATQVRDALRYRVAAWSLEVEAGHAQAGPLAPILSEYFDRVPMLGRPVQALLPDGQPFMTGTFAGVDVWGRATVVTDDGRELELSAEQASLRALEG